MRDKLKNNGIRWHGHVLTTCEERIAKEHSEHETKRKKTEEHQDRNKRLGKMSHGRKLR